MGKSYFILLALAVHLISQNAFSFTWITKEIPVIEKMIVEGFEGQTYKRPCSLDIIKIKRDDNIEYNIGIIHQKDGYQVREQVRLLTLEEINISPKRIVIDTGPSLTGRHKMVFSRYDIGAIKRIDFYYGFFGKIRCQ